MAHTRQSILDYLGDYVLHHGDETAMLSRAGGAYRSVTWRELGDEVDRQATLLLRRGLDPGDRVVLLAQTRQAWVSWDLAIIAAGGVSVPIYPSNLPDDCQYICEHSGAKLAITDSWTQSRKLLQERSRLPGLGGVLQMDPQGPGGPGGGEAGGWVADIAQELAKLDAVDEAKLAARRRAIAPESAMSIIYTSGTTGRPKGAVISHRNMTATALAIAAINIVGARDVQLLFLPLAHAFARVLMVAWLATRHRLALAESMDTLRENLLEVRPTIMAGVPRVYEKFFAAVEARGSRAGGLAGRLFSKSLRLSARQGEAAQGGGQLAPLERLEFRLLRHWVFARIGRELGATLGGRMRVLISGGAPLAPNIAWFFRHAGINLVEGFGLTETCAASCINLPEDNRIGSVGRALPNTELRLAEDGELLIRGEGVSQGYWDNPTATLEAFRDGWFLSGDLARVDGDGFVHIVDRKKDIIVTAGGKNIAPQNLENLIKTDPLISQVVVHGDRRNFLTALITLDPDALKRLAERERLGAASLAELSQNPRVVHEVQGVIERFNGQLARYETIKKFRILEHDFSIESGELTPSLKLKRRVINERYRSILDAFYVGGHDGGA